MKKILIIISLMISINSYAGLGWLFLGAAFSGSNKNPPVKSEMEIKINQIKSKLPQHCGENTSVYSSCWKGYSNPVVKVNVDQKSSETIFYYFKNLGYDVRLEGSQLSFNFEKEYEIYKQHQQVFMSFEGMFFSGLFLSVAFLIFWIVYSSKKRFIRTVAAYENNKDDLLFWDKKDKFLLDESLNKNEWPLHWFPHIENGKLVRISYLDGHSAGVVATSSSKLIKNHFGKSK